MPGKLSRPQQESHSICLLDYCQMRELVKDTVPSDFPKFLSCFNGSLLLIGCSKTKVLLKEAVWLA